MSDDATLAEQLRTECDRVGLPHDAALLVRHHRANAQLVGAFAARSADADASGSTQILVARWNQIIARDDTLDLDALDGDELVDAARCYIAAAQYCAQRGEPMPLWVAKEYFGWPLGDGAWRPPADPVACLAEAGAMLAAEIDRHQALEERPVPGASAAYEVRVRSVIDDTELTCGPYGQVEAGAVHGRLSDALDGVAQVRIVEVRRVSPDDVLERFAR